MKKLAKKSGLVKTGGIVAPLLLASVMHAAVADVTSFVFDADGGGSLASDTIDVFDWLHSSALLTAGETGDAAIPFVADSGKYLQIYAQGALSATALNGSSTGFENLVGMNGDDLAFGVFPPFEITYTARFGIDAVNNAAGTSISFKQDTAAFSDAYNSFEMYYDAYGVGDVGGTKSVPLAGTGYNDGDVILRGKIVRVAGGFSTTDEAPVLLDSFIEDQWNGTTTVVGTGANQIAILVTEVDDAFFVEGVNTGSIVFFNTSQLLTFLETNPAKTMATGPSAEGGVQLASAVGSVNGISGTDMLYQIDPNQSFQTLSDDLSLSCRVTGGGNDTSGVLKEGEGYDNSNAAGGVLRTTGNKKKYSQWWTMGGQAGANTGSQPQPKGEWQHQNHGDFGEWGFHFGTASALPGTEIDIIVCSDEEWCVQARPAPTKQIDFAGVGNFHNLPGSKKGGPKAALVNQFEDLPFVAVAQESYHWVEVHIEDLGEPGNIAQHENIGGSLCPVDGSGTDAFAGESGLFIDANCDCPDFYRIRIYAANEPPVPGVDFNDDGSLTDAYITALKENKTSDFYEAAGYIDGGNFQIHPPTGFDLKNGL